MLTLKPFQRLLLVPADPAVRQRSPQNRCWRSSVSDAHHSWQLFLQPAWQVTSVIQALFLFIFFKRGKKKKKVFSLWNDPKMLWFWDKQLCQRVSIKNLYATARLWSSRRERERFHLQRADANDQQTRELWMYLSYFTSLTATGTAHQIFLISVYL